MTKAQEVRTSLKILGDRISWQSDGERTIALAGLARGLGVDWDASDERPTPDDETPGDES